MIRYAIGTSGQIITLTDAVVARFAESRQVRRSQLEAGGQLFARFDGLRIVVEEATGPRPTDRRTRSAYIPDRAAEQQEILDRQDRNLHFIGDWHTHPSRHPTPSLTDVANIAECVRKSTHALHGFLLVIVGLADPPTGLHVSIHDGNCLYPLASG